MRIIYLSLLVFCSLFVRISADNAALPYEILVWYYAYKAQVQSGLTGRFWNIFYGLNGQPLRTFGGWAADIIPRTGSDAWPTTDGSWVANAADETFSPSIANTNRLVEFAPPENARIVFSGMNYQWDYFAARQQNLGRPEPGMTSMFAKMLESLQMIWAANSASLSTADLGAMKEAMQEVMNQRQYVNWVHMFDFLSSGDHGSPFLTQFLHDGNGNHLNFFDVDQILENIDNHEDSSGDEKENFKEMLMEYSSNFGSQVYGEENGINWSKWGGADTHSSVIATGQRMVDFLQDKLTGANQLPAQACST